MTSPVAATLVGLVLVAGCGTPEPTSPAPDTPRAWWQELAQNPSGFHALLEGRRDGWIALHQHDYPTAYQAFVDGDGPDALAGALRAALSQALLHHDQARLVDRTNRARHQAFLAREAPSGEWGATMAVWGSACAPARHEPARAEGPVAAWLVEHTPTGDGPPAEAPPMPPETPEALAARLSLHRQALAGSDEAIEALYAAAANPVFTESGEGFQRPHVDPCIDATLSVAWTRRARALTPYGAGATLQGVLDVLGASPLGGSILAPWPRLDALTVGELDRPMSGSEFAEFWALPPDLSLGRSGDTDAVHADATALTAWTETERSATVHAGTGDGPELVTGLSVLAQYRQGVMVAAARQALREDRAQPAQALLEAARDVTIREAGAANAPELYVLLAEARLENGRTREALDALEPLAERLPTVHSARELVGDLAVLQSIDRIGDSKESP